MPRRFGEGLPGGFVSLATVGVLDSSLELHDAAPEQPGETGGRKEESSAPSRAHSDGVGADCVAISKACAREHSRINCSECCSPGNNSELR